MPIREVLDWFAGDGRYMTLVHCMGHDRFWIGLTVFLDFVVASGYVLIALHWRRNEAILPPSPAKAALGSMKKIFVFCGLCGYLFIPIKMYWPAWRLYDAVLVVLAYYTWKYALSARSLKVIYEELGRTARLAEDLVRSQEEGRRKSYFLNAISHDLKTPLNGMMLQTELAELNLDSNDPEALREALVEIKSCARTTADLLDRFLEIGRLDWSAEPSRVERLDLSELFHQVANQARARAERKGLRLSTECPPRLRLAADRVKLERILFNLVDNAIKFTREGSVDLSVESEGAAPRIVVEDTGEGIRAEDQASIFDDFIQVHNRERDSRKGFGLGLAIARRLAHQLGGDLTVESQLGRGSRFILSLPADTLVDRGFADDGLASIGRAFPAPAPAAGG